MNLTSLDGKHNFYCCRCPYKPVPIQSLDGKHNFYCCRYIKPVYTNDVQMVSTISTVVDSVLPILSVNVQMVSTISTVVDVTTVSLRPRSRW